jgi:hypothetical protein
MVSIISSYAYATITAIESEVVGVHDNRVKINVIKYKIPTSAAKACNNFCMVLDFKIRFTIPANGSKAILISFNSQVSVF